MSVYNINTLLTRLNKTDIVEKHFSAGDVVFREGREASHLYFVLQGEVRVERYSQNGQPLVFFRAMGGSALHEAGLFVDKHPYTAIAITDSKLVLVQKKRLLELMQRDWTFAKQFFHCMVWRYTEALMLREFSSIRSADERLRMWFEWQVSMGQREFDLEGRMGGLGADLGLTRESVYRSLARLEKGKFLKREHGRIRIL